MLAANKQISDATRQQLTRELIRKLKEEKITSSELYSYLANSIKTKNEKIMNKRTSNIITKNDSNVDNNSNNDISCMKSFVSAATPEDSTLQKSTLSNRNTERVIGDSNNVFNTKETCNNQVEKAIDNAQDSECLICNVGHQTFYCIGNKDNLCFACFRACYVAFILPYIDTLERRKHDKQLLSQIQSVLEHEKLNFSPTLASDASLSKRNNAELSSNNIIEVKSPEEASFVMNASFLQWQQSSKMNRSRRSHSSLEDTISSSKRTTANESKGSNFITHTLEPTNNTNIWSETNLEDTVRNWRNECSNTSINEMSSVWNCPRCAFINTNNAKFCIACELQNPGRIKCQRCGAFCAINTNGEVVITNSLLDRINQRKPILLEHKTHHDKARKQHGYNSLDVYVQNNIDIDINGARVNRNVCVDGSPHVLWFCNHCNYVNTHDGEKCERCALTRSWVCCFCTERQNTKRTEDGLRICRTCGAYNTPTDVFHGQIEIEKEMNKNRLQELYFHQTNEQQEYNNNFNNFNSYNNDNNDSKVVFGVNDPDTLAEQRRQAEIASNKTRLNKRLNLLSVQRNVRIPDGNCLFSSLSNQLFGKPQSGHTVRTMIVQYMTQHSNDYSTLFPDGEWTHYVRQMRSPGFWGDELCLNAAARCFEVDIHVITSDRSNWHIVFQHNKLDKLCNKEISNKTSNSFVTGNQTSLLSRKLANDSVNVLETNPEDMSSKMTRYKGSRTLIKNINAVEQSANNACSLYEQESDAEAVCVFLSYLYPVHYDDLGNTQQRPLSLENIIIDGLMNILEGITLNNEFAKNTSLNVPKVNYHSQLQQEQQPELSQRNDESHNNWKDNLEHLLWEGATESHTQESKKYNISTSSTKNDAHYSEVAVTNPNTISSYETVNTYHSRPSISNSQKSTIPSEQPETATSSKVYSAVNYLLSVESTNESPSNCLEKNEDMFNLNTKSKTKLISTNAHNSEQHNNYQNLFEEKNSNNTNEKLSTASKTTKKSNSYSYFESGKSDCSNAKNIQSSKLNQNAYAFESSEIDPPLANVKSSEVYAHKSKFTNSNDRLTNDEEVKKIIATALTSTNNRSEETCTEDITTSKTYPHFRKDSVKEALGPNEKNKKKNFVAKIFRKNKEN